MPARGPTDRSRGRGRFRGVGGELAERAAWSVLAALLAAVGAGLALAIGAGVVPALCRTDDAACGLGWLILIGMGGYLLAMWPASLVGRLGVWYVLAYLAGYAPLMMLAQLGEWWWWTALAVLPPLAAVLSAPLGRDALPVPQRSAIAVAAAAGLTAMIWWYAFAR